MHREIYKGPADSQPEFAVILAIATFMFSVIFWTARVPRTIPYVLEGLVLCSAGVCAVVSLLFRRDSLSVDGQEVVHTTRFGPISLTKTFRATDVSHIRVEVFSFDPWDPHLAFDTPEGTRRIAWGLSESELKDITARFKEAIGHGPN